jgi:hypothetical protein
MYQLLWCIVLDHLKAKQPTAVLLSTRTTMTNCITPIAVLLLPDEEVHKYPKTVLLLPRTRPIKTAHHNSMLLDPPLILLLFL